MGPEGEDLGRRGRLVSWIRQQVIGIGSFNIRSPFEISVDIRDPESDRASRTTGRVPKTSHLPSRILIGRVWPLLFLRNDLLLSHRRFYRRKPLDNTWGTFFLFTTEERNNDRSLFLHFLTTFWVSDSEGVSWSFTRRRESKGVGSRLGVSPKTLSWGRHSDLPVLSSTTHPPSW